LLPAANAMKHSIVSGSDPRVSGTTRRQPEYGAPVGIYINRMASAARIENAARKAESRRAVGT